MSQEKPAAAREHLEGPVNQSKHSSGLQTSGKGFRGEGEWNEPCELASDCVSYSAHLDPAGLLVTGLARNNDDRWTSGGWQKGGGGVMGQKRGQIGPGKGWEWQQAGTVQSSPIESGQMSL